MFTTPTKIVMMKNINVVKIPESRIKKNHPESLTNVFQLHNTETLPHHFIREKTLQCNIDRDCR